MKRFFKSVISISLSLVLVSGLVGCSGQTKETVAVSNQSEAEEPSNLVLWYTNEDLSAYIEEAAKEYALNNNVVVTPKLVSEIDYIEKINQAVLSNEAAPDLFIAENCDLEKLYLAGLTSENQDTTYSEENYYKTSLNAFTYEDRLLAYPLYFETSYLLYNQEYVATPPSTIDEILNFANEFDAPVGVESILNWDVADILSNYFFVGNYLNNDEISNEKYIIDKDKLMEALRYYQSLNQYFAIDADTVDYEVAFQNFIEGKSVFTIAKTDKLPEIEMIEGDASEEVQENDQDGNNDTANGANEKELNETKENEASTEEHAKNANQDNEKTPENNQADLEGTTEQSSQTSKTDTNLTAGNIAGVERILSQNPSVVKNEENVPITDVAEIDQTKADTTKANTSENVTDKTIPEANTTKTDSTQDKTNATDTVTNNPGSIIDKNSNFKIAPLPNLTRELEGKGIAVSFGLFVNGYTKNKEEASKLAKYLSYDKSAVLYQKTGKLSARNGIDYKNENIANVLKEYEKDVAAPKIMDNGDFWLQLEIAFSNIWKGEDITKALEALTK